MRGKAGIKAVIISDDFPQNIGNVVIVLRTADTKQDVEDYGVNCGPGYWVAISNTKLTHYIDENHAKWEDSTPYEEFCIGDCNLFPIRHIDILL